MCAQVDSLPLRADSPDIEPVPVERHVSPNPPERTTKRAIGPIAGMAIVAGSMLGVGIFLVPAEVAQEIHSLKLFLGLWVFGGLIAFSGAVAYAELGTMFPKAGGDYVYLRETFGVSASFAAGWLLFVGVFAGSIATMSVAVCQYQLPVLLSPFVDFDLSQPVISVESLGLFISGTQLAALGLVLLLTLINTAGVRPSTATQTLATVVPVLAFALFALFAIAIGPQQPAVPYAGNALTSHSLASSLTTAFLAIYFAYAGWNALAYVGGEVVSPEKNIPRSLLGGTVLITFLYLIMCTAFLAVLGLGGLPSAFEAGTATAVAVVGSKAEPIVAGLIGIALLGSLNGTVLGGGRIGYAMAKDRALPRTLSHIGARSRVPSRALWAQAIVAGALICTGTFETLLEFTSIAMLLLGGLTVAALFVLRVTRAEVQRPYRASGYPWTPALYLIASILVVSFTIKGVLFPSEMATEEPTLERWFPILGLVFFLCVFAVHALFRSRESRDGG